MSGKIFGFEAIVVLVLISIAWIAGFVIIRKLNVSVDKKFELTVRHFTGMTVFLIIYNIYLNVQSNAIIEKNRSSYNTLENIQQNWLDPQKELLDSYPEGYFLYASITQDADFGTTLPTVFDSLKRKQVETFSSIRIFQAMENFLTTGSYDVTGNYIWINNFLMWMQSPILRSNWTKLSFNYATDTREFVNSIIVESDKLIELRKKKGKLSAEDYDTISKNIVVKLR